MSPRMGEDLNLALALEGRVEAARIETRKLVALAGTLATLPEPEIDATFAASLEATLLGEFDTLFSSSPQLTVVRAIPETPADEIVRRAPIIQMPRRRHVVRRSIVAVAAAASLAAFPLVASASSLPGSSLHGMKRGIEQSRLVLFGTPLEDGFFHMELSHRRANELNQLIALGASQDRIEEAAGMVDSEMNLGRTLVFNNSTDALDLSRLATMAERTEVEMRKARAALDGDAQAAMTPAIQTSTEIQQQVRNALGLTIAPPSSSREQVVLGQFAANDGTSGTTAASSGGSGSTGSKAGDDDGGTKRGGDDDSDLGGKAKNVKDAADDGCEVAGSAQGLGDVLAPATKLTCSS